MDNKDVVIKMALDAYNACFDYEGSSGAEREKLHAKYSGMRSVIRALGWYDDLKKAIKEYEDKFC